MLGFVRINSLLFHISLFIFVTGSKRQSAVSSVRVEKHATTKKEMIIASDSEQGKSQCMYIESVMQTLPAGGKVVD